MAWATMPADILLELCINLDLRDAISLLTTCSRVRGLLSVKDFWLKSLRRVQKIHMQPLPCPPGTDLSRLPVDKLRDLAIHAHRLQTIWAADHAVPVSLRTLPLGEDCSQVIVIPGTRLVITDCYERLTCWDAVSGQRLAFLEHNRGMGNTAGKCTAFHGPGFSLIGFAYETSSRFGLIVVKISYNQPDTVDLTRFLSEETPKGQDVRCISKVAIDSHCVGIVVIARSDGAALSFSAELIYCIFSERVIHRIPLPVDCGNFPGCLLHAGHFYVKTHLFEPQSSLVLRVCADQSSRSSPCDLQKWDLPMPCSVPGAVVQCNTCSPPQMPSSAEYGILSVTRRILTASTSRETQHICTLHFWTATPAGQQLVLGEAALYSSHPRYIADPYAISPSGRSVVIIDRDLPLHFHSRFSGLGLVRFVENPVPHTAYTALDTAAVGVPVDETAVIAVDDALGVVYLTRRNEGPETTLSVLSYV